MNKVQIVVNDWMTSMGATALMRLDPSLKNIEEDANEIKISVDWLKELPEILFEYLINHYSVANREIDIVQDLLLKFEKKLANREKNKDKVKENIKWINDRIKGNIDKIIKYYPETEETLQKNFTNLKKSLGEEDMVAVRNEFSEISIFFKRKDIDEKLTLNWVKAALFSAVAGQASFLNVAKNSLNYEEQKKVFAHDYILPVLWEQQLRENFNNEDEAAIEQLFEIDEKPDYASKWKTAKKKSKVSWCEWLSQLPECTLIEGQFGVIPFEEMYFVPLGMSAKICNYAWAGNIDAVQPISSLAKLLLFLSPLGATRYRRLFKGEPISVFGFLNNDSSCYATFELNNQLSNVMKKEGHFSDAIKDSFHTFKNLETFRNTATVLVEWDTEYKAKKTVLEYKILNHKFVDLILNETYGKKLSTVFPYDFREQIVRAALDNVDSKHVIIKELRRMLDESFNKMNSLSIKKALLVREYLNKMEEDEIMETEKTVTEKMYNLGFRLSKTLGSTNTENKEGHYQAPDEKKLTAVAYRLLNATKAGNRQLFFDTAVRLHIQAGMNISKELTKVIDSATSDKEFATIAMAFTAGLIPQPKNNDKQTDKVE